MADERKRVNAARDNSSSLSLSFSFAFSFGLTVPMAYDWPTRTDCSITFWPRVNALLMSGANDVVEETGTTGWVTTDVCVVSSVLTFVLLNLQKYNHASYVILLYFFPKIDYAQRYYLLAIGNSPPFSLN